MGGAKLLGEGSGGRLRPPVGPGQSPGRGPGGKAPRKLWGFKHLINKFPNKSRNLSTSGDHRSVRCQLI